MNELISTASVLDRRLLATRSGVIMEPDGSPAEAWGVLNPAIARDRSGGLWMFPRIVAEHNLSRVSRVRVRESGGRPVGVERDGIALEPSEPWERNGRTAGIEDPRITFIPELDRWVMAYAAYGPFGAKVALAVSEDLQHWTRLGPVDFGYEERLHADFNLYRNKDAAFFPEAVLDPEGRLSLAMVHRPMWDIGEVVAGAGAPLPAGVTDERLGIWISFVPLDAVRKDIRALRHLTSHTLVALPEHPWEALKIGAGAAPARIDGGWLLVHHGVRGVLLPNTDHQPHVVYSAGAMVLHADDVTQLVSRTAQPLLEPTTADERVGIVPNVIFPTAMDRRGDDFDVYYGMADSRIGVARLTVTP